MLSCLVLSSALSACSGAMTAPDEAPAQAAIASVVVQPGVADVQPGLSLRFDAQALDTRGRAVQTPVRWEATGGSIDGQGLYVAGATPGEFEVRALTIGEILGRARIRIGFPSGGGSGGGSGGESGGEPTGGSNGGSNGGSSHPQTTSSSTYLVVGSAASPNQAEQRLRDRLQSLLGSVSLLDDDQITSASVGGCRLIVMSKTVTSTKIGANLKSVSCGVVFWEDNQQKLDMMATVQNDGSGGTHWQANSQTLYVRPDAPSELRAGLAGQVPFYQSSGIVTHSPSGDLPSAATVVAELYEGSGRKAIYAYEKGQRLADGSTAVGRRVYFGLYDDTFAQLSPEGLRLFDAAVTWASGAVPATPPPQNPAAPPKSPSTPPPSPSAPPPSPSTPPPSPSTPPPSPEAQTPPGVAIRPGESIQAAVNARPAGTTFILKAGVHRGQSVEPKDGMTFYGEPGAVLDGGGISRFAFGHYGPGSRDVTIKNLEIRNYLTKISEGAIQGDPTTNWTVEGNDIHHNGGFGIRGGRSMRVLRNHAHHNGDAGIHGYRADGMLVEGNEVDSNGDNGVQSGALATAAGMKFFRVRNLVIRDNYVHDNKTRGIWTDTDCMDVVIEGNRVVDNGKFGIWHEISYRAVIRNNHVERNGYDGYDGPGWLGGAGIAVTNSPDVEIYGNTLIDNADGIAGMQASGYPASGAFGAYVLANLNVHDNTIVMRQGRTGIVQNVSSDTVFANRNNRFARNTYQLGRNAEYFAWLNGSRDESDWRSYGHDVNGSFRR